MSRVAQISNGCTNFFNILSHVNSYAIPLHTAARWAPSFARWRTPYINILRLVRGVRPLESQVITYGSLPCENQVMSYLSSRRHAGSHFARWRTAHSSLPILTEAAAPKHIIRAEAHGRGAGTKTKPAMPESFAPLFWEAKICTPFFRILGPGELPQGGI